MRKSRFGEERGRTISAIAPVVAFGGLLACAVFAEETRGGALAKADEFHEPWRNREIALVIDPYEGNRVNWEGLATDQRVVAIVHRASQGMRVDRKYAARRAEAIKRGYLWGSYHLGVRGDPVHQASFYLGAAKPSATDVTALDIESLAAPSMRLDEAPLFLDYVKAKTGRYPLVYGNHEVIRAIVARFGKMGPFASTRLWYARFLPVIRDFPHGTWDTYTMWQFCSEVNCARASASSCPYRVPGTDYDMDINVFNGSIRELRRSWPFR